MNAKVQDSYLLAEAMHQSLGEFLEQVRFQHRNAHYDAECEVVGYRDFADWAKTISKMSQREAQTARDFHEFHPNGSVMLAHHHADAGGDESEDDPSA